MKTKDWSSNWKSSAKKAKKTKYLLNAPLHVKGKFLHSHLSKELRTKYKRRSLRVKKGDTVKIMRGEFKGKEGKVQLVNLKLQKVYVENMAKSKKDGSKVFVPFNSSKLLIKEIVSDKKRI